MNLLFKSSYFIMDHIKSILNLINNNGCSAAHITELTNTSKFVLKNNFKPSKENIQLLHNILALPFFSDDVHTLFDIVLSGLLMYDNSNLLWAKVDL